jgi:hypothetical protein
MITRRYLRNMLLNMAISNYSEELNCSLTLIRSYYMLAIRSLLMPQEELHMSMTRWEHFRGLNTLQEQVNRLFEDSVTRTRSSQAELASWAPGGRYLRNRG